jgi:hypothetical protein
VRPARNPVDRFLEKIVEDERGCQKWRSRIRYDGYGTFMFRGKTTLAHRVAWTLHRGEIPDGMCVLHKCDVRDCVNPEHLFLGTVHDNIRDMDAKKRRGTVAKLNPDQVKKVHEMLSGGYAQQAVADVIGVHQTVISRIKRAQIATYL